MSELLPCPFCGGEAETVGDDCMEWIAECIECCASSMAFATEAEAIAAWNTRAEMSYEDVSILLDELGISERTCKMEPSFIEPSRLDFMQEYTCSKCGEYAYLQIATDDDRIARCPNCGRWVR